MLAEGLATQAWFVQVKTPEATATTASIDFVAGKAALQDVIAAVLHHSQLDLGDEFASTSRLGATEIGSCGLRPGEVRTYGRRVLSSGLLAVERAR